MLQKCLIMSFVFLLNFSINASSLFSFLTKTSSSSSDVQSLYDRPVLLARANIVDGFNLPAMSYINNSSPSINDRGDVVFRVLNIEGTPTQGLWGKLQSEVAGKIYVTAPDERFITEPKINNNGMIVFSLFDEGITDGLFTFNLDTLDEEQIIDPSRYSLLNYTYPVILENGDVYFRGTNDKNDRTLYRFVDDELETLFTEGQSLTIKPGVKSAVSYIFRPDVIKNGTMAMKQRFGKRYDWGEDLVDGIVLLDSKGKSSVRLLDLDGDEFSQFKGLSNTLSLNNNLEITFIGFLNDGKKAIYKSTESETVRLAFEGDGNISEIEYFTPKINDNSEIYFRAKNLDGKRGIYLIKTDKVIRLIGEDDEVQTDLGEGRILWNKYYPGFSGEIDVNVRGDVVFHALLVTKERDRELGAGIFVLPRKITTQNVETSN